MNVHPRIREIYRRKNQVAALYAYLMLQNVDGLNLRVNRTLRKLKEHKLNLEMRAESLGRTWAKGLEECG